MFVFLSKDLKRVKILVWEITGYWLCSKKLEGGRFVRPVGDNPASRQSAVTISAAELAMLLDATLRGLLGANAATSIWTP